MNKIICLTTALFLLMILTLPILREALYDDNADVRLRAVQALEAIGSDAEETLSDLATLCNDSSDGIRRALPSALCKVGGVSAVDEIILMLSDSDAVARREAVIAFGTIGSEAKEAVNELVILLGDVFIVASQINKALSAIAPNIDPFSPVH